MKDQTCFVHYEMNLDFLDFKEIETEETISVMHPNFADTTY